MDLSQKLGNRHLILASGSPRRQQFLRDLGLDFEIRLKGVEETYPEGLSPIDVVDYLTELKATAYQDELAPEDILITGDTIVARGNRVLGKPKNRDEAIRMLWELSGKSHLVVSAACIKSTEKSVLVHAETTVFFKALERAEIDYYIDRFSPYDKAGAYGIQEWIGQIGIERIEGSFYNVMGMPIAKVYTALKAF